MEEEMSAPSIDWNQYQDFVRSTKRYSESYRLMYPVLGLTSEAGEVAGKVKKILRDNDGAVSDEQVKVIIDEVSDVLWYVACIADDLGIPLEVVMRVNVAKLLDRVERDVIQGDGDDR